MASRDVYWSPTSPRCIGSTWGGHKRQPKRNPPHHSAPPFSGLFTARSSLTRKSVSSPASALTAQQLQGSGVMAASPDALLYSRYRIEWRTKSTPPVGPNTQTEPYHFLRRQHSRLSCLEGSNRGQCIERIVMRDQAGRHGHSDAIKVLVDESLELARQGEIRKRGRRAAQQPGRAARPQLLLKEAQVTWHDLRRANSKATPPPQS